MTKYNLRIDLLKKKPNKKPKKRKKNTKQQKNYPYKSKQTKAETKQRVLTVVRDAQHHF